MLRKIKLHNWKAHAESEFNFSGGTNVIVGQMGAGKSSILQAVSFALFGTFSELKSKDLKISDLVSRNAEIKTASIELELALANKIFQIKRVVEEGSTKEAVLRDGEGRLLAGTNPAQVNMYLKDILKIDEDVFLRTIYAKQNEIDLFLQLRPNERKARLDEMMFIDKFENARKNCVKLGNQIEARKSAHEELVRDFRIEELEKEIASLERDCETLQKEKENLKLKVFEVEKEKANIDSKIKSLRKIFDERSRLEEKKQLLEKQLEELKEKLQSAELDEDVNAIIAKSDAIKTKISENQKSKLNIKDDLDLHRSNALDLERNLGILENKSAELSEQLKKSERLRVELRELEAYGNILFLQGKIKDADENVRRHSDERLQLLGEISGLKKHLAELEQTKGACPVCASELAETKKSELVSHRKNKISELEAKTHELQGAADEIGRGLGQLKEIYQKQKDLLGRIEQSAGLQTRDKEVAVQLSELKGKRATLSELISQLQQRFDVLENEISILDGELAKLNEKKSLYELKDRQGGIEKEIRWAEKELETKLVSRPELEDLEGEYSNSIRIAQEIKSTVERNEYLVEEKQKRLKDFGAKKKNYLEVKEKIAVLESKTEFLSRFKNALLLSQDILRKELIRAVNEVMAGLWAQLYPYEKWSSVRLDASEEDYVLQLREKEGEWINVAGFASGGERMVACLALRLAFAKVLAQNMNILILDEPTHNLDDRAISTLVEVIQNRLSDFLEQLFIITHDEKLAEAGDNVIKL